MPTVCAINPPAMGPTTGPIYEVSIVLSHWDDVPIRGPRLYKAIAEARSRAENRSPTEPPPIAIGALPENPAVISLKTPVKCPK